MEMADRLSRLSGVAVVGSSGATGPGADEMSPAELGREVGAEYVLLGTIRWREESDGTKRVRVNPQVVRTADGERVWGEPFEERFTDVFDLQANIAERVAAALDVKVIAGEQDELRRGPTQNLEAWQAYAQGRAYHGRVDGRTAVKHYKRAIELDPDFALAYAGLADAYHFIAPTHRAGFLDQRLDNWARSEQAALRALALDSTLGEAHVSLGSIYMFRDFDWQRAEESITHGLAMNPDYAQGHSRYRNLLHATGRHDSAAAEARRAVALDPLNPLFNNNLGVSLVLAGHVDEGFRQFAPALQDARMGDAAYYNRALAHAAVRDWEGARDDFREFRFPPAVLDAWWAAVADSLKIPALRALLDSAGPEKVASISPALGFLLPATADKQLALDMLEMAVRDHAGDAIVGIDFVDLKGERRYQALRQEMRLDGSPPANDPDR